jgi:hypothetical protein
VRPPGPLIALVAAIVYISLVIAAYGFLSLILHRDIITEADASVLVGPIMALAASAAVFWIVLRGGRHRMPGLPWGRSVVAALVVWVVGPAVGGMFYAIGRSEPFSAITFFFGHLATVYTLASVVAAFVVVLLAPLLDRPGLR